MNSKIKDLLNAVKDESIDAILSNEKIINIVAELINMIVSEGSYEFIGNFIRAISPRINSIRLSYKQARFERHIVETLKEFKNHLDELENNYNTLSDEIMEKFNSEYLEWFLDNLYEEKQSSKVKYHVNGFIKMMNNEVNDNLMLMFFNTMNELTELDIDVLKIYDMNSTENLSSLCNKYNLDNYQVNTIKMKLERLGLLEGRNNKQRDANLDSIVKYLNELRIQQNKRNPNDVKVPKIKKISHFESYSITSLGKTLLTLIYNN